MATRWILLDNNTVQQILEFDPSGLFHASISWHKTEDANVVVGSTYHSANGNFSVPEIAESSPPPTAAKRKVVTPIEFKLQFTLSERLTIAAARTSTSNSNSAILVKNALNDWFSIIDDPRLTEIRLDGPTVIEGAAFLVQAGILTQDRANTIMEGI